MAKIIATVKIGSKERPLKKGQLKKLLTEKESKGYHIKDASLKDGYCNYTYEITEGVGIGDNHTVKGKGVILDDMTEAFAALNVHLACIDDAFKMSGMEIKDIDKMHSDEITTLYHVTGFKMKGSKEDEAIVLIGNKYVSAGGRIELETPKIVMDNLSSYKWYNELKAASDRARLEVELYKEGKCTIEDAEEKEDKSATQMTISDAIDQHDNDDFEDGKVK